MAASRSSKLPIGSAPWVVNERRQAMDMINQEAEDFSYSVRNELEWLNEHMAEIFAPGNLNVTNIFKTPGKLRGKTPRTARKREALGNRAPLSDIFAPNTQAQSPNKAITSKLTPRFHVAEDAENPSPAKKSPFRAPAPPVFNLARNVYTDSGYHGATDDEMDVDQPQTQTQPNTLEETLVHSQQPKPTPKLSPSVQKMDFAAGSTPKPEPARISNDSFVSAKENLAGRQASAEQLRKNATESTVPEDDVFSIKSKPQLTSPVREEKLQESVTKQHPTHDVAEDAMDLEDVQSPSDGSSPIKPLGRKSSLTFSSIPAREPLGKTSFGARVSHVDSSKSFGGMASQLSRATGSRITGGPQAAVAVASQDQMEVDSIRQTQITSETDETETMKIHNKTSTQRLHDRINMLGQMREVRPSKSLHTSTDKPLYPSLASQQVEKAATQPDERNVTILEDEEDWIAPLSNLGAPFKELENFQLFSTKNANTVDQVANRLAGIESPKAREGSPLRPTLHKKMPSTTVLESPTKAAMAPEKKPISVSNPTPNLSAGGTTTPHGSPPRSPSGRRLLEGPLSASKAKFYSVLKSAKGIFASSAGVSALAKMEANSPGRARKAAEEPPLSPSAEIHPKPALFPNLNLGSTASPVQEGRRTRSSTEREQKRKEEEQQRAAEELKKIREKERHKATAAASQKTNRPPLSRSGISRPVSRLESQASKEKIQDDKDDVPPPPPPKSQLPTSQTRINQIKRVPVPRPTKEPASKAKPPTVIVRMPSTWRIGQAQPSNNTLSQSLHETLPPPPPPKNGFTSHANSSTASIKSTTSASARRAEAAAKKKEQEAKVAQRKAEQKKEMEQKRVQRLDEERKQQEQRKVAEQQRIQEARKVAQRKMEEAKRLEQERRENQRPESRHNGLANALHYDKPNTHQAQRGDVGQSRPLSKANLVHDPPRPVIQVNPAKPPKRALPADNDVHAAPERPAMQRNPPSYQQLDAKRRKTNDDDDDVTVIPRGSVMGPPMRQSNIKKDPPKFAHGFAASHSQSQSQSMMIKTVTTQHHLQHGKMAHQADMAKYASGRIPFADAPNPPAAQAQTYGNPHKTPVRATPASASKLSPYYTPGENIELPEIPSDSEDEDSENEFIAPSWTESPELREALRRQQLVDPESVFGPIGPLHMEEVFKDNKERLKKFRQRTSSAHWNGPDRLTDSERKRDREARERMQIDGGWDFQSQRAAMARKSPRPL